MKYDAKRHYLHPVLTPHNDDYPGAELTATVSEPEHVDNQAAFNISFNLTDHSLAAAVKGGNARCKAMVYCRDTLLRVDLEAPEGSLTIPVSIPIDNLSGTVEVHPFIVSVGNIDLATNTINPEYAAHSAYLFAGNKQPLAAANRYEFDVNTEDYNVDALIVFESDSENNLPAGEFDIRTEISARQIFIIVNSDEFESLFEFRRNERLQALSSIYMSALVQAFCMVADADEEDEQDAHSNGWYRYLKSRQQPGISPFRMAQVVFKKPFQRLIATIP